MKYKIGQIVQLNESNYWWSNVKGEIVSIDSNCRKPYYKIKLIEGANKGEHYELPDSYFNNQNRNGANEVSS